MSINRRIFIYIGLPIFFALHTIDSANAFPDLSPKGITRAAASAFTGIATSPLGVVKAVAYENIVWWIYPKLYERGVETSKLAAREVPKAIITWGKSISTKNYSP
jgi:hypothetical protein